MTITYSTPKITFKTWHSGMNDFHFSPDGISLVPRAGLQISQRCPENYRSLILQCINNGWLKAVAHQPIHEAFMEELSL
jgi:hypothetical protein